MNRSNSPETGFIDPRGDNAEAIRDLTENVLDQLLEQLGAAEKRLPLPAESTIPMGGDPRITTVPARRSRRPRDDRCGIDEPRSSGIYRSYGYDSNYGVGTG